MQAFLRREGPMGIPMAGFVAVGVAAMLLTVVLFTTGVIGGGKEPNWQLIDYDPNQTEAYANGLLALGHPEWEGRMSGTAEEHAAAQSILDNLTEMGYTPQMNSYPVDMFSVNSEPSLRMCPPGANPWSSRVASVILAQKDALWNSNIAWTTSSRDSQGPLTPNST